MSTIKTTYIQHPSATNPNIELAADGTVALPMFGLEDLDNVSATPADGEALVWDAGTSRWVADTVTPTSLDASVITSGVFDAARVPLPAGIGTNVQSTLKTDTYATTLTQTWQDVTGMTVTITPTVATSKVLLSVTVNVSGQVTFGAGQAGVQVRLLRGATVIGRGDAAGSRERGWTMPRQSQFGLGQVAATFLDSPATTSATTYKVQIRNPLAGGAAYVNRTENDADNATQLRGASTITAIEVSA